MNDATDRARDLAAAPVRYEVESELNPHYAITGADEDYYGVYNVVLWQGDTRIKVVATYNATYANARFHAYARARRLNTAPDTATRRSGHGE